MIRRATAIVALSLCAGCGESQAPNALPLVVIGPDRMVRPGETIELTGASSTDSDGTITSYAWDFGDGQSATGVVVQHAWADEAVYAVTLTVQDDRRGQSTGAIRVTVTSGANQQPTAVIAGPSQTPPQVELTFDGSGSSDPDGTIAEHRWDFGDGAMATGQTAQHTFTAEGQFVVTLTVEDDRGAVGQATRNVTVSTTASNQPPVAAVGPDIDTSAGVAVTFDGTGSIDPDGSIVAYRWTFGDGDTAETPRAMHAYANPGTYAVSLEIEDDDGATASASLTVTVAPPPSYDGDWILNPVQISQRCDTGVQYLVPFPVQMLRIAGTVGSAATAEVIGANRVMTGSVDRTQTPPVLSLAWTGTAADLAATFPAECGSAVVEHRFNAQLPAEDRLGAGRFTTIFTWDEARCRCSRTFDVTGARP